MKITRQKVKKRRQYFIDGNFHTFKVLFSDTWHKTDGNFRYIAEYITDSKRIYEAYSYDVKAES